METVAVVAILTVGIVALVALLLIAGLESWLNDKSRPIRGGFLVHLG